MKNFIEWDSLSFKKQKGQEKLRCPSCDGQRTDKKDRSLQINHNDGFGKCHYCEALSFRDENTNLGDKQYAEIDFKAIVSVKEDDKMISYMSSRLIKESTLNRLYVTFENYWQPALNKKVDNIVFNYYEGSKLVNKKYRSAGKKFTQTTNGKPIFYNINSVIGQKEVFIVEGEFDVLAMVEAGYKNTISVPNGANDNDEYWKNSEKYLKDIKKFVIAVDNDEKGIELKNKIAQRLGRYRCTYIEWKGKDANDDLISGCIKESVNNVQRFPVSGTFTVSELYKGIIDLYENGLPETIYPKHHSFSTLKNSFSVMRGQLTVITGIPSGGKSNFNDWYVLNLIKDYNMKCSWFTPEHSPMELYQTNLIEKVIGRNFWREKNGAPRITKQQIEDYKDWANEKIYLTDSLEETPTWDWLLEKFKEQMYSFGIDIFVIDAFNKVLLPTGNKIDQIQIVLTKLTHFAQANNVLIFLVAHPTKMQTNEDGTYNVPTLYDVSGSADFRNITHNGYTVHRNYEGSPEGISTDFYNMKTKFNFQGNIGDTVRFQYCDINGRYYANGMEPTHSFLEEEEVKELPKIELTQAFDIDETEDEIPF
jgi:twinkle protein